MFLVVLDRLSYSDQELKRRGKYCFFFLTKVAVGYRSERT